MAENDLENLRESWDPQATNELFFGSSRRNCGKKAVKAISARWLNLIFSNDIKGGLLHIIIDRPTRAQLIQKFNPSGLTAMWLNYTFAAMMSLA